MHTLAGSRAISTPERFTMAQEPLLATREMRVYAQSD